MSVPSNSNLGIPLPPSNLAPTIQKQTGSATGNPRNKCALKPGHSLMDWIRLGNSGCDLSGTKGAIVPVSTIELSKHCTQEDAWMAIRGKVYNVTRYMDFHPGGPEELMRGVGKDATKLFDEIHAWVNYEQLLKKCLIGPLRNVVKIDTDFLKPRNGNIRPPAKVVAPQKPIQTEVIPRFDWIQKKSDLTFYFYTKQFCNPGLILRRKSDENIVIRIIIENACHQYDFVLHSEVKWPPTALKVFSESGKIELNFTKAETELWPGYGTKDACLVEQLEDFHYEFEIIENKNFNHNSFALILSGRNGVIIWPSVGYHLTFSCCIEGAAVSRSYTSIPKKYSIIDNGSSQDLHFLLKTYDDGLMAKHIYGLKIGSEFELSQPKGSLRLNKFLGHTRIALLAAGSGITPMLGLIDHLLARNSNRIEALMLMYFNRTEEDIWCRTLLEDMAIADERFHLIHILSQPSDEWSGEKGHISADLLSTLKDQSSKNYSTFVCICGPPIFNNLAETNLTILGFPKTALHFFNG